MNHHKKDSVNSHLELAVPELESVKQKSVTLSYGESVGFKVPGFSTFYYYWHTTMSINY